MRQKNDQLFTALLKTDSEQLQKQMKTSTQFNQDQLVQHIWAENYPVENHNRLKLEQICKPMFTVTANDQYPKNVKKTKILKEH